MSAVVQQLRTWGFDRLEAVIASHLDLDHVGGMLTLLNAYHDHIGAVYFAADWDISETRDGAKKAKALADRVGAGDRDKKWELRAVHRDTRAVSEGEDWSVHVVAPRASGRLEADRRGGWDDPNRYSAVLRVEMAGKVVLVGGDAPLATWAELHPRIRADVFRVPHPGAR